MKKLALLLFLALLFQNAKAQVVLEPNTTEIFVTSIVLERVDPSYEYTRTSRYIAINGDLQKLNLVFAVRYFNYEQKPVGADCYLNCPYESNISSNCSGYPVCNFLGFPGIRVCSFVAPAYNFTATNKIICRFYDPAYPEIEYLPYPNRTFYVFNYTILTNLTAKAKVGSLISYTPKITNIGLIKDSYDINVSLLTGGLQKADVSPGYATTDEVSYAEQAQANFRIVPLVSDTINIGVWIKSNNNPYSCSSDANCSFLSNGVCLQNKCWEFSQLVITTTSLSLSEYGFAEYYFAALIATLLIFKIKRKK